MPRSLGAAVAVSAACSVATAPILLAAVRGGPAARDRRERPGRAGRRAAARPRLRRRGGRPGRAAARGRARVGERLDRGLHRVLRAARLGGPGRAGARRRRCAGCRGVAPSPPPMLGEDGGGAQTGLSDRRQRPAEGRPHGDAAAQPVRGRRDRAAPGRRHDRRRRGRGLQRDGPLRSGHAARGGRRRRGVEGAGRESGRRVSEGAGARDDARARRRRAEEGLAAREGGRGQGRAAHLGRRHEARSPAGSPTSSSCTRRRSSRRPAACSPSSSATTSTSSRARSTRSPPGRTVRR